MGQFQRHHYGRFFDFYNREAEYTEIVGRKGDEEGKVTHLVRNVEDRVIEMHKTGRDVELGVEVVSDVLLEKLPLLGIAIKVGAAFMRHRERVVLDLKETEKKPAVEADGVSQAVTTGGAANMSGGNTGPSKPHHKKKHPGHGHGRNGRHQSHAA